MKINDLINLSQNKKLGLILSVSSIEIKNLHMFLSWVNEINPNTLVYNTLLSNSPSYPISECLNLDVRSPDFKEKIADDININEIDRLSKLNPDQLFIVMETHLETPVAEKNLRNLSGNVVFIAAPSTFEQEYLNYMRLQNVQCLSIGSWEEQEKRLLEAGIIKEKKLINDNVSQLNINSQPKSLKV